jgi:nucleoside-diphosphate-sugar epimerase
LSIKPAVRLQPICTKTGLTRHGDFHTIFPMKTFVTGGTGFIGSHFINYLLGHKDAEIYALVRNPDNLKWLSGLDINVVKGDLFSIPSLPADIDYVVHIAGITKAFNLADYYTVNQHGTASIFKAFCSQGITPKKIIYLSSIAAAGPSLDGKAVKETDIPHPLNPYGKSKLLGEKEAMKFKDVYPLSIIRVGVVFGPRDKDLLAYFKFINKGILPSVASSQRWLSFCYIKDLISAIDLCLKKDLDSGEIFNIANPQPSTWDDFGKEAGKAIGKKLITVKVPFPLIHFAAFLSECLGRLRKKAPPLNRQKYQEMKQTSWIADTTKAEQVLSFSPNFDLQIALRDTFSWYRKKGWL